MPRRRGAAPPSRRRTAVTALTLVAACLAPAAGCSAPVSDRDSADPGPSRTAVRFPGPENATAARVTDVTDGDTITLSGLGRTRLIGVDTPEVYGGVECYGRAASAFTKAQLPAGRRVLYRLGVEPRDRYGRALAYVWLRGGVLFNGLLAERGFATPLTIPPNDDYARLFLKASRRARRAETGLWANDTCADDNSPALATEAGRQRGSGSGSPGATGCDRFATHDAAQRWFERHGGGPDYDAGRLDGDGDGEACE
jgi:micrococcal nuclease